MIDAERMLGSLVRSAMSGGRRGRRRRRGSSLLGGAGKGTLALGALGVAMGVFEHFTQKQGAGGGAAATAEASPAQAQPPLPPVPTLPPLPPTPVAASPVADPPPPGAPLPPVPRPADPATADSTAGGALLMVRAMIAAANADHELDDAERGRIFEALEGAEAGDEEKEFVRRELEDPIDMASLAALAPTPELANQVYLASLIAIEVDTKAERNYLDRLARRLGIEAERASELEAMAGGANGEG